MQKLFAISTLAMAVLGGAAQAQDWSGFYAGLFSNSASGTYRHYDSGVIDPSVTTQIAGNQFGGFAGYNLQSGNLVYGAELAHGAGDLLVGGSTTYFIENLTQIRGRVGYATGIALIHGSLGWARADQHWDDGIVTNSPVNVDGASYGVGVDVMASDRLILGLAWDRVKLVAQEGDIGGFPLVETRDDLDIVTLRVGMRF